MGNKSRMGHVAEFILHLADNGGVLRLLCKVTVEMLEERVTPCQSYVSSGLYPIMETRNSRP